VFRAKLGWIAEVLKKEGFQGRDIPDGVVEGVSIDTRKGCRNALFVALRGANSDGHGFLSAAVQGGAKAVIVRKDMVDAVRDATEGVFVFDVKDTLTALQLIASAYRETINPRVIAVTGSTGKTTTKELVASVLSTKYRVHATPGNLNNHIGLPLTVLGMEEDDEVLVTEMGANHRNEIKTLCKIARPTYGAITNIGPVHLEFFGNLKGVARAKAELVESLPESGKAILPADSEFFEFLEGRSKAPVLSFGYSEGSSYRISTVERVGDKGYRFKISDSELVIGFRGKHNILNAAVAYVVGKVFDLSDEDISEGLEKAVQPDSRGGTFELDGIKIIDDTYNSNPSSLKAAVEMLMEMPVEGKRWLVLGDMLELGSESKKLHEEAGVMCGRAGVDGLVTIGEDTVELNRAAAAQRKAPRRISHFLDPKKLAGFLNDLIKPGDCILVKGSRGMRMEQVIEELEVLRGTERKRVD